MRILPLRSVGLAHQHSPSTADKYLWRATFGRLHSGTGQGRWRSNLVAAGFIPVQQTHRNRCRRGCLAQRPSPSPEARPRLPLIDAKTLHPIKVPSAIEKIAATVVPSLVISPSPAAASPSDSKLNAPGTNAQNAASIITIAGGDALIRAPNIANGTTRKAPTAPACVGDRKQATHPTFPSKKQDRRLHPSRLAPLAITSTAKQSRLRHSHGCIPIRLDSVTVDIEILHSNPQCGRVPGPPSPDTSFNTFAVYSSRGRSSGANGRSPSSATPAAT